MEDCSVSRKPIAVVAREATDTEPIDLEAWVRLYVATLARLEGITLDSSRKAA